MYVPLNRIWSKKLAIALIALGILMMPDIIAPTPFMDLLINVPLAMVIADIWTMEYLDAFMVTYIISFVLVFAGLMIYPYNTERLIIGRLRVTVAYIIHHPGMLLIAIIGIVIVYFIGQWAYDNMYQYAKEVVSSAI